MPTGRVAYAVRVTTSEGEQSGGAGAERTPGGGGAARPEERLEQAVRAAEQALIEFEIAVETFRVEVENFSRLHEQKLGPMYVRLEELDARILEAKAARSDDPEDRRRVSLEISESAMAAGGEFFGGLQRDLVAAMAGYSDQELAVVARFLTDMTGVIVRHQRPAPTS